MVATGLRDAFLAEVHVAVLAVDEPGRDPLALPIWYQAVDGAIEIGMDGGSRKAELLRSAGKVRSDLAGTHVDRELRSGDRTGER